MYSEKATKFCEIFTLLLSYVVPVKSKTSQSFVAFSENMNFTYRPNLVCFVIMLYVDDSSSHSLPKPVFWISSLAYFGHFYGKQGVPVNIYFFTQAWNCCLAQLFSLNIVQTFLDSSPILFKLADDRSF